jgi:hypothetical protein
MNSPHNNWLLWHFKKGRKTQEKTLAEKKVFELRKEFEVFSENHRKTTEWLKSYRGLLSNDPSPKRRSV